MEAKAINKYIGTSPRKMRLVIDLIRGKGVEEALGILHFTSKHAARTAEQVLRSAISNAQNREETGRIDTSTLYVKEAFVNGGTTMKRIMPAPMGRAFHIRKRSNHITIIVAQREKEEKPELKAKVSTETKKIDKKLDKKIDKKIDKKTDKKKQVTAKKEATES
jgi:large subunit ribosomal protein L22